MPKSGMYINRVYRYPQAEKPNDKKIHMYSTVHSSQYTSVFLVYSKAYKHQKASQNHILNFSQLKWITGTSTLTTGTGHYSQILDKFVSLTSTLPCWYATTPTNKTKCNAAEQRTDKCRPYKFVACTGIRFVTHPSHQQVRLGVCGTNNSFSDIASLTRTISYFLCERKNCNHTRMWMRSENI